MKNPILPSCAVSCAALLTSVPFAAAQNEPSRRVDTPGAQVQINQIETSQFPRVVIFATVLKGGAPVPGLTNKDFRVREDEVDQEPLTVVPKLTPLSAVMTLDTSGSMKKRLPDAQAAAKSFIKTLEPQDKVQVIRFSRDVKTIYPLGSDRTGAEAAIDTTVARGDTALWDALYASLESLRTVAGRKAIVLLSDGVDDDGSGKPLSKHTVTDVLALARQVNTPIYAIGIGTELDEVNLRKVATDSGALYLSTAEPGELKRLFDSIGKQLAGQYTIYYNSNLPADGSEHRVQLKFGSSTSTKSYLPPVRVAAAPPPKAAPAPAPVPPPAPAPVEVAKPAALPGTPISDKTPSSNVAAPVALNLGEVVTGRLAASDETKKYHYWLLDLPAGKYKFVVDAKRADDEAANIGGRLHIVAADGKEELDKIGWWQDDGPRSRGVFHIEADKPLTGILRYSNIYSIADYWLGVFHESDVLTGLFFVKPPPVAPIKIGQAVSTPIIDGENPKMRDAYYSITLPAGDYKVSLECRRADQQSGNVGGAVHALDVDGMVQDEGHSILWHQGSGTSKGAAKFSLADEAKFVFRVRAIHTKLTAVLGVEKWKEE